MNHKFYITYADLPLSAAPRAWVEVDAEAIRHNYRTVAAEIAKTGFVADYFRRCFQREMGQTPTQYLISLRMERAKQLLRDPKHFTVEAIAHSCGFAAALYFSTCFKKHVGCSPLEDRKQ